MNIVRLLIFFLGIIASVSTATAAPIPVASIKHQAIPSFSEGERLALNAALSDQYGISVARCYFKTESDGKYLYATMDRQAENSYQCILPAFKPGSGSLEYFFLIVNGKRQVIRSISYFANQAESESLAEWQIDIDASAPLQVYSELETVQIEDTALADTSAHLVTTVNTEDLFGLLAGVYETEQIPDRLNVMPGFFGGFILDDPDTEPVLLKGFAPNLKVAAVDTSLLQAPVTTNSIIEPQPSTQAESDSPPDIAGLDWSGYFKITGDPQKEFLDASIEQEVFSVHLVTTKSDLGHYFFGSINSAGDMYMHDVETGEIWTTHFGPATSTEIGLYDYVELPSEDDPDPPYYKIKITRPPQPPSEVSASDGTFRDKIVVTWTESSGTDSYVVYSCTSEKTDSCSYLATVLADSYEDTRETKEDIYFRLRACSDEYGCSDYSGYDIGSLKRFSIVPLLEPILLNNE